MTLEIFDIPEIYADGTEGQSFVHALAENENIDLFASESVQKLINYHWDVTKLYVYFGLFIPLCA